MVPDTPSPSARRSLPIFSLGALREKGRRVVVETRVWGVVKLLYLFIFYVFSHRFLSSPDYGRLGF